MSEQTTRPEWVKCVTNTRTESAWCGRTIFAAFAFQDAEHAALNGEAQGRLVACSDCTDRIKEAICAGQ